MKYSLNLNENNKSYPIVFLPSKIIDSFNKKNHFEEILSYLGVPYHPISLNVFQDIHRFNINNEKNKNYSLSEYLDLENFQYNFLFGDFYLSNPLRSEYKLPKRPNRNKDVQIKKNNRFLLIVNLIFNLIIFFVFQLFLSFETSIIILFGLSVLTCFLYFLDLFEQSVSIKVQLDNDEYNSLVNKFKSEIDEISEKVINDFLDYKNSKLKIAEQNREKVEREIYEALLKSNSSIIPIQTTAVKGRTEVFFLSKLYGFFGKQIKIEVVPNGVKNPYQPDFLLICEKTGFHLVIEIDEPYSVENGRPIHHDRTNDDKRVKFFESLNWGIVRFSERQVVQSPIQCCQLIKSIIDCILNRSYEIHHDLELDSKWTYEEAVIMASNNFRNSYLPLNMQIQIRDLKKITDNYDDDLPF